MRLSPQWTRLRLGAASLIVILAGLTVVCAEPKRDADKQPVAQERAVGEPVSQQPSSKDETSKKTASPEESSEEAGARRRMVERQLRARDITDARVLAVMGRVPRHEFVPERQQASAYADHPLPIDHGQTISQPYIVALMTQLAGPKPTCRALDIGTGSGYQAAVLGELCKEVYSIEIVEPLADSARERLKRLGYRNVTVRCGDGYRGWPEKAPLT